MVQKDPRLSQAEARLKSTFHHRSVMARLNMLEEHFVLTHQGYNYWTTKLGLSTHALFQ